MQKLAIASVVSLAMLAAGCAEEESSAPTFQVTSPTLVTTSSTTPSTLAYLGVPDLSSQENEMCRFIGGIGRSLDVSDQNSRMATAAANSAASDRTLSEPFQVRGKRDAAVENAQRFANVLSSFTEAADLIAQIEPNESTDQARLQSDAADINRLIEIGSSIERTANSVKPLSAEKRSAYEAEHGEAWTDIRTEADLNLAVAALNNATSGMGLEAEARDAMERVDDWSWRHCSAGLTR